jgi:hypothetical protein
VAAHGEAAGGFDEQEGDVAIRPRRRIQDGAGHHVVAARLEAQRPADPVEFRHEMRPLLHHIGADQVRPTAGHQPHRIAAGMAIDAEECVHGHG